jgi:hypothetical protein
MRLTWHDAAATVLVGAVVSLETLHLAGTDLPGLASPRALTGVVLGLGLAACIAGSVKMESLPPTYARWMSYLGTIAVITGLAGLITGAEIPLIALTAAAAAMWLVATMRHLLAPTARMSDEALRELIDNEQAVGPRS